MKDDSDWNWSYKGMAKEWAQIKKLRKQKAEMDERIRLKKEAEKKKKKKKKVGGEGIEPS